MIKILFLAETVGVNQTSAGLGSAKMVESLNQLPDVEVCLMHGDAEGDYPYIQSRRMSIRNTPWSWHNVLHKCLSLCDARLGTSFMHKYKQKHGFSPKFKHEVNVYAKQIQSVLDREDFDLIFTRAKGSSFRMHAAMLRVNTAVPWLAYYHDPFPFSLYPKPYREDLGAAAIPQENLHRQILEAANFIAAPTQALLDFVCTDQVMEHQKAVIPHPGFTLNQLKGNKIDCPLDADKFNLLHAGTLLGVRNPEALFEAWKQLNVEQNRFRQKAQLTLVGPVQAQLSEQFPENIRLIRERIPYQNSLEWMKLATANLILEPKAQPHPFFPGKLADALHLKSPIVALSSKGSGTHEVLGENYPLRAEPDQVEAIKAVLWQAFIWWESDELKKQMIEWMKDMPDLSGPSILKQIKALLKYDG